MLGEKAELSYFCSCKYDKEIGILRIKKSLFQLFLKHTYINNK